MITIALALEEHDRDLPPKPNPNAAEWALFFATDDDQGAAARGAAWAELKSCFKSFEVLLEEYIDPRPAAKATSTSSVPWPPAAEALRRVASGIEAHYDLIKTLTDPNGPWMMATGTSKPAGTEIPNDLGALLIQLAANAAAVRTAISVLDEPAKLTVAAKAIAAYLGVIPSIGK